MKDLKSIFLNLEKKLKQSSWFDDGWEIFNRGTYLQLYKVNWHNHNQGGIHFETYIETPQIKQKAFPVCMHAEKDCPSQSEFIEKFLELEGDRIKSWKGYQTVGKGYNICQRTLPLNLKKLEQRLFEEFNNLRQLGPSVEQILRGL
ncbi:MAG: hypothetical protein G3M70_11800 [Candidatus Nitronauta litoralis]|uniref:DUF4304 domain-containing protein n=1 Tax=Candidatus Nitronauta litoralis TaxID=2705533 RepID=A0A7T0BX18_9BACT|nr:MAG: hypothetical protein G3M70_11800 [Candidatus Nitronauta litoralis]